MIDQLCDEQLLIAQMVRRARRRGDFAMVSQYMRCWQVLDTMIKRCGVIPLSLDMGI
jgi:hypothetical protein